MIMPFGRYKGLPVSELPDHYIGWLWDNVDLHGRLREAVRRRVQEWDFDAGPPPPPKTPALTITPGNVPLVRRIVDAGYRVLALQVHPDHGGDPAEMRELSTVVEGIRGQLRQIERGTAV